MAVGTPNLVPYHLAPGSLCITTISLVDLPVKYRCRDRMFDSLQVMGLCTWVSGRWACVCTWADTYVYPGRHVCTWTDMCVPGQTCVHAQVCVCVHEQACVCTWTDMCVHEQGMCAQHTRWLSPGGPLRRDTQESPCCSLLWHCPSSPTSGEGVPLGTCTPGAQPFSPGLGDRVQDVALTRMDSSLGPQSCSSDSGRVAHDPPGFLAAPLHLHCSAPLLKREVLQETVPAARSSGRSSSKGGSGSSTGTLQIGTLAL